MFENCKIVIDNKYGYRRLDPIPTEEQLEEYYKNIYYNKIRNSGGSIKKIIKKDNESAEEIEWMNTTYFLDALKIFNEYMKNEKSSILDIGCGLGEMLKFFQEKGFDTFGIEPSSDAIDFCKESGINVFNGNLYSFISKNDKRFDIVNLSDVLEHIPNPENFLLTCKNIMNDTGILRIKVPNDFNEFQQIASKRYNLEPWWVCIPDHVNYFNLQSLSKLLEGVGFNIIHRTTDFPMEIFLLMGDVYIKNSDLGRKCHKKRVNFEESISSELRQKLYSMLCEIGLGREIIVYATKK